MQEKIGLHCVVSGLVQGVWFRASTQEKAVALDLTGWAKNLSDGTVEVVAFGEKNNLLDLHAWLMIGPKRAKVTSVTYKEIPYQEIKSFMVQ